LLQGIPEKTVHHNSLPVVNLSSKVSSLEDYHDQITCDDSSSYGCVIAGTKIYYFNPPRVFYRVILTHSLPLLLSVNSMAPLSGNSPSSATFQLLSFVSQAGSIYLIVFLFFK